MRATEDKLLQKILESAEMMVIIGTHFPNYIRHLQRLVAVILQRNACVGPFFYQYKNHLRVRRLSFSKVYFTKS